MIEVDHVTKVYGNTTAVDDVSFTVPAGEILGFLGPNGAGKTTTMKIITGFIPATGGTTRVDGFDVFAQPLAVKQRIGYVPETVPLYTDMTVRQYLRFMASIKGVAAKTQTGRVNAMVARCGLAEVENKLIHKLSKGYRQRVGLAQALVHDPPILILDEPTVGLDPKQIIEIRTLIKELGEKKTVILSSHILPEVSMTCERVLIIHRGKIAASGTPASLTSQLKGAEQLFVLVEGPAAEVSAHLRGLADVKAVKEQSAADGRAGFVVESALNRDIRRALAGSIVQRGWGLLELRPVGMSLEDIFLQLTTSEPQGEAHA
jgi:ABC-2 type transport system ATP-binding protein